MLSLLVAVASAAYLKPVTALACYNDSVYIGRADGAVEQVGADLRVKTIFSGEQGKPISFVAASPYGVAWLTGPGGSIREKVAPRKLENQILTIASGGKAFAVTLHPSSPVRRLNWVAGRVAVCYDFGAAFFDSKGRATKPVDFMPPEAAQLADNSALWVREQEDGTELALFARPYSVRQDPRNQNAPLVSLFTAFQIGAWQWEKIGGFASNALDAFPDGELKVTEEGRIAGDAKFLVLSDRVGLATDGVVAREPESLASVPIFKRDWEISRVPAATVPGDSLWFGAAGDNAWWWNGTALVQQERSSGATCAYLPWAMPFTPHAFAADTTGIWVGSDRGLRHLDPAVPDEQEGFAGFVKAPFGLEATSSIDPNAKKLSDAVFAWRFASADRAGADGGIMVSSIYSAVGIQLPQKAAELSAVGTPVRGELKFGDVVLTDRSAALYLGNGITVEVRGGKVQNGDLWAFPKATVRRFAG